MLCEELDILDDMSNHYLCLASSSMSTEASVDVCQTPTSMPIENSPVSGLDGLASRNYSSK
jgi:hypothetical protein